MKYVIKGNNFIFQADLVEQSEIITEFKGKVADDYKWNPPPRVGKMSFLNKDGDYLRWNLPRHWCFVAPNFILYREGAMMRYNKLKIPYLWLEFKL